MGQRASQVGALHFDNVKLPAGALLGPEGRGFHIMMSVLDKGRVGIGALAVGILQAGARCVDRLRPAAPAVRQADRGLPGDAVDDRRHGQGSLGRAADDHTRAAAKLDARGRATARRWNARWPSASPPTRR